MQTRRSTLAGRLKTFAARSSGLGAVGFVLAHRKHRARPLALGAEGKDHQHIFFGTGTYNPVWALSYFLVTGEHSLATYANGIVTLYENEFGYTGPSLVNLGATFNYSVGIARF